MYIFQYVTEIYMYTANGGFISQEDYVMFAPGGNSRVSKQEREEQFVNNYLKSHGYSGKSAEILREDVKKRLITGWEKPRGSTQEMRFPEDVTREIICVMRSVIF